MDKIFIIEKSGILKELTWKDVVHPNGDGACWAGRHISKFAELVIELGYTYFTWNGDLYKILPDGSFQRTALTRDDIS